MNAEKPLTVMVIAALADSLVNFRGQLLKDMVNTGHKVYASAASEDPLSGICTADIALRLKDMGVSYRPILLDRTGLNPLKDLQTIHSLCRLMKEIKPDVVFSYTMKPVIYGSIAAMLTKVPAIYSMISGVGTTRGDLSNPSSKRGRILRMLYRMALCHNKQIIFQNLDDRELFVKNRLVKSMEDTVVVNGSGVDISHYQMTTPKSAPISFLLIARLLRDKGVYDYVKAATLLKKQYSEVSFRLLGPLDNHPDAVKENELRAWQDAGTIEYLGVTSDVRPFLTDSSVYVLPSAYGEGTPRTILEALAIGRPIITTDAPGCRETVVPGQNGYLVPIHNVNALATAMERFINEPAVISVMGQVSRHLAESKYDVRKVNEVMLKTMRLIE